MADKPNRASGYAVGQVEVVRATCLYVATKLKSSTSPSIAEV